LTESHTRKPESELAEKLPKVEKAFQNAVIKEIMAEFGLEGVTKEAARQVSSGTTRTGIRG